MINEKESHDPVATVWIAITRNSRDGISGSWEEFEDVVRAIQVKNNLEANKRIVVTGPFSMN